MRLSSPPKATATAVTEAEARSSASASVADAFGLAYSVGDSHLRNGRWRFMVVCHDHDLGRALVVGVVSVDAVTGQVNPLTGDQIRDVQEAGAVQAAQKRGELARDRQGYVLRYHARIKATIWISDHIDLKVGANGGILLPLNPPVWRFSVDYTSKGKQEGPLGVIDVDATTGQVLPLTDEQLHLIRGGVRAAKQPPALAPAA